MDKIAIANLSEIINVLKYSNICLHPSDITQFTNIPWEERKFYPAHYKYKSGSLNGKRGFFNNGKTTIWEDWHMEPGTIKIATHLPTGIDSGWSDVWSFAEEGSVLRIYKYMKLKVFW